MRAARVSSAAEEAALRSPDLSLRTFAMTRYLINRLIKVNSRILTGSRWLICLTAQALVPAMAKEVERKFLVTDASWRDAVETSIAIIQFYLAISAERSIRVRISNGENAKLTLKFGSDLQQRDEFEYPVPLADAREMLAFAIGTVISKTRHHVRHKNYLYEVDVFNGELDGLVVAELETTDKVGDDLLPAWLDQEVTGELRYSNASLALNGFPERAQ